jgi:hypothetical protein
MLIEMSFIDEGRNREREWKSSERKIEELEVREDERGGHEARGNRRVEIEEDRESNRKKEKEV